MAYIGTSPQNGVRNRFVYAATQGQTAFTGADADSKTLVVSDQLYTDVYQNGVKLKLTTDWTASSTTVTLVNAASADDVIEIVSFDVFSVSDTVPASTGGTFNGAISATSYGAVSGTTGTFSGAVSGSTISGSVTSGTTATLSSSQATSNIDILKLESTGTSSSSNLKFNVASGAQGQIRLGGNNDISIHNTSSDTTRLTIDGANGRFIQNGTSAIGGAFYSHDWNSVSGPQMGLNSTDASGNPHNYFIFQRQGTQRGSISVSGSATAYNTSSDYRMKENVNYTWDATARLKQLKPARFNFIDDASNTLVDGFLAHEVSLIVPEAITGTKDAVEDIGTSTDSNGVETTNIKEIHAVSGDTWVKTGTRPVYQGIDQSKLVPLLIKTIQELEARITALEAE